MEGHSDALLASQMKGFFLICVCDYAERKRGVSVTYFSGQPNLDRGRKRNRRGPHNKRSSFHRIFASDLSNNKRVVLCLLKNLRGKNYCDTVIPAAASFVLAVIGAGG